MLKTFILLSAVFFGIITITGLCDGKRDTVNPIAESNIDNSAFGGEHLTISEINERKPKGGIVETKGFVALIYTCPPCPSGAQCKPCMRDNVVISEDDKMLTTYDLTKKQLILFGDGLSKLEVGTEYRFRVRITSGKTTEFDLKDFEVISVKSLEN